MNEIAAEEEMNAAPELLEKLPEHGESDPSVYEEEAPPPAEKPLEELPHEKWAGKSAPADAGQVMPLSDWMAGVPDNIKLSDMSIPGTHESCSRYDTWSFGYAQCQDWSLPQQFAAGVRFVDIRCRVVGGGSGRSFAVHHGDVYQKMMFGDAMQQCWDYLQAHPGETILMRLSQTKSNESAETFRWVFDNSYATWRYRFHIATSVPDLGQVRGKIVLMTRAPYIGGLNLGSSLFDTQDVWERPTIAYKKQLVHNHLVKAINAGSSRSQIFMNYTSANSGPQYGVTPWAYARDVNPYTLSEANRLYSPGRRVGVIAMDFINHHSAVTAAIVKMNKTGRYPIVLDMSPTTVSSVPYAGGAGQSFRIVPQADGSFGIRSVYFNSVLGMTSGGAVTARPYTGGQDQSFSIVPQGDGSIGIRNKYYDRVLTFSNTGAVSAEPYTGHAGQSFTSAPQADGSTGIRSRYFWTGS
ncbi:phosphatidylinositol-specific phospholipase C domain-containing protein [Streptomyces lydicus]|uniref:phosphatidylinositol-specific phospholipase C domain-containing protein n=1 Tax=Streptomyces lydicus TaxID=47763 RepID=UPI001011F55E|nr:phosphatidylinositol-specific phospholipase C domain-containing protein [Streptomyces lydicus]MCZ1006816.1 phosphatidylinositol-specific phospholipase C domain-containing protein [Streptomyces lydicus]